MNSLVMGLLVVSLIGCSSSQIREISSLEGSFARFNNIEIRMNPGDGENESTYRKRFARMLADEMREESAFTRVGTEEEKTIGADLWLQLKFVQIDEPQSLTTVLAGGMASSEVKIVGEFTDPKTKRSLAKVEVTGNSKYRHRTSVGGIGITSGKDHTLWAMENAAERIVKYVLERKR